MFEKTKNRALLCRTDVQRWKSLKTRITRHPDVTLFRAHHDPEAITNINSRWTSDRNPNMFHFHKFVLFTHTNKEKGEDDPSAFGTKPNSLDLRAAKFMTCDGFFFLCGQCLLGLKIAWSWIRKNALLVLFNQIRTLGMGGDIQCKEAKLEEFQVLFV